MTAYTGEQGISKGSKGSKRKGEKEGTVARALTPLIQRCEPLEM